MGNVAEVMFGKAFSSIMFGSLAAFMAKFSRCVSQKNHRRFLSGGVVLGVFIFLIMIGNTFSERIPVTRTQFQVRAFTNFLVTQKTHLKHLCQM